MKKKKRINIGLVEDDIYFNQLLRKFIERISTMNVLSKFDIKLYAYTNAHECIDEMDGKMDIMILDYLLINPYEDDFLTAEHIIEELYTVNPGCVVIVMSGQENPFTASRMLKMGVYEYIDKNVNDINRLQKVLVEILQHKLKKENDMGLMALKHV